MINEIEALEFGLVSGSNLINQTQVNNALLGTLTSLNVIIYTYSSHILSSHI
jgi:hypothetical protein